VVVLCTGAIFARALSLDQHYCTFDNLPQSLPGTISKRSHVHTPPFDILLTDYVFNLCPSDDSAQGAAVVPESFFFFAYI
jgi:hypothetical protein